MEADVSGEPLCNMCGETCCLGEHGRGAYGLVDQLVGGGYHSTAGNGHGALDDLTSYRFSLCEFCLDWLFSQFKLPVTVINQDEPEAFRPAAQRVKEDDWRHGREAFFEEQDRRAALRSKRA